MATTSARAVRDACVVALVAVAALGAGPGATVARGADAPSPDAPRAPLREVVLDRDDLDVTESVRVRPGTYRVRDAQGDGVLRVTGKDVEVHLEGVELVGCDEADAAEGYVGVGVRLVDAPGARVVGGRVRGFRVGVGAERSERVAVEGLDASRNRRDRLGSTPAREDPADWLWPHENDDGQWAARYGAGISLSACPGARVTGCRAHDGQNGLLLAGCRGAVVTGNDFSRSSGWGVALWRTDEGRFEGNRCDLCVRGWSDGVYARGQDSAGFLVFEQCSRNVFVGNSATHSGDGFFLYAGHETLRRTGTGGCNDNVVADNDFSWAVANGIEATFSGGNQFLRNRLVGCDHGVWAGYSYGTLVRENTIEDCAHGVSIEHGTGNAIVGNRVARCGVGVHLWWDRDEDLLASAFATAHDTASARNEVMWNTVEDGRVALRLDGDRASVVRWNALVRPSEAALDLAGDVRDLRFVGNLVDAARAAQGTTRTPVRLGANRWRPRPPTVAGTVTLDVDATASEGPPAPAMPPPPRPVPTSPPSLPGRAPPPGRAWILVDERGPVDPDAPGLFPRTQAASGAATVAVLGVGPAGRASAAFRVVSVSEGFDATMAPPPADARAPAGPPRVVVRPRAGGPTVARFELVVRVGERDEVARGTVLSTRWTTRFWAWTKDPREDRAAFDALVAEPPRLARETDGLDVGGPGAPAPGVPADRFATVAETTLDVGAGRWRLRVVSDDGVRVLLDGRVVHEDWTWHAPREAIVDVDLAAGRHTLRLEHFELDGWAALRCDVEPAPDGR